MKHQMSLSARREMLVSVYGRYQEVDWSTKGRILDGFVAATGYDRKYAIQLLNGQTCLPPSGLVKPRPGRQMYDAQFLKVLVYIWHTANQVCSKRLVPFIPELVYAMERHGHPVTVPASAHDGSGMPPGRRRVWHHPDRYQLQAGSPGR